MAVPLVAETNIRPVTRKDALNLAGLTYLSYLLWPILRHGNETGPRFEVRASLPSETDVFDVYGDSLYLVNSSREITPGKLASRISYFDFIDSDTRHPESQASISLPGSVTNLVRKDERTVFATGIHVASGSLNDRTSSIAEIKFDHREKPSIQRSFEYVHSTHFPKLLALSSDHKTAYYSTFSVQRPDGELGILDLSDFSQIEQKGKIHLPVALTSMSVDSNNKIVYGTNVFGHVVAIDVSGTTPCFIGYQKLLDFADDAILYHDPYSEAKFLWAINKSNGLIAEYSPDPETFQPYTNQTEAESLTKAKSIHEPNSRRQMINIGEPFKMLVIDGNRSMSLLDMKYPIRRVLQFHPPQIEAITAIAHSKHIIAAVSSKPNPKDDLDGQPNQEIWVMDLVESSTST